MKKIFHFLIVLPFLFSNCHKAQKVEKDPQRYYPKVKTLSAVKQPDGSVIVTGQVMSEGNNALQYAGFCMDTVPNPDMITNQVLVYDLSGDKFTYTFPSSFTPYTRYYFRAWVANANGYSVGEPVYADNIGFDTSLIPCRPLQQHMVLTGSSTINEIYTLIDNLTTTGTNYGVHAMTGSHSIDVTFGRFPIAGEYTVTSADYPNEASVTVSVDYMRANGPSKLYVAQIAPNTIEITICSLNVTANVWLSTANFNMTTRFQTHTN